MTRARDAMADVLDKMTIADMLGSSGSRGRKLLQHV
jgi:DNA-binding IscR family transcriptional regulator